MINSVGIKAKANIKSFQLEFPPQHFVKHACFFCFRKAQMTVSTLCIHLIDVIMTAGLHNAAFVLYKQLKSLLSLSY